MAYPPVITADMEDEDDWLEPPTQGGIDDPLVNQEFNRLSNKFSDAGYREGITDGKLSTLQVGFDEGFAQSVPLSRRVGALRGKAAALLAIHLSSSSTSSATSHSSKDLEESLREIVKELGRLKRDEVLPEDRERIQHEKEEHGDGGDDGFELDRNDRRDMEDLENTLEMMGGGSVKETKDDGEMVVERLEVRLKELERAVFRR
ncbi:hypothetical protein I302_100449 [Kwoniella bestiolae CBS 10118]|uniref:Protein YAE1 n=1 Tax=Kwoniella bestiolae CBS 10118 TaxID=1296100 RepID=A0A1B9G542_9TREE|nr:hypothetical protein I302_03823 [Kwoniella bestiolae CBS 10118]OCF26145.1 hypothetical protein I302_03823 [Kwoniella bestiolae CBS 10118]